MASCLIASSVLAAERTLTNFTDYSLGTGGLADTFDSIDTAITNVSPAALDHNYIYVGNSNNEPVGVAQSGDGAFSDTGVFAITAGSIVNADVNASAAIAWSKMATSTDITTAGTVSSLTLGSDARGDVYYRGASGLVRLPAGTAGQALVTAGAGADPYWGLPATSLASKLTQTYQIETGTNDITHAATTQTVGGTTLTIPDFASVNDTYSFVTLAQTLANKTLTTPVIASFYQDAGKTKLMITPDTASDTLCAIAATQTLTNKTLTTPKIVTTGAIVDAGGDEYLKFVEATTPVTYAQITSGDTGVAPRVQGAGETNTDLHLLGSGTGNVYLSDGTDPTKDINFELNGATTAKTMTIISSQTDDRSLTLPDATDTLVGKATTDTLTNKTIDADGTGNVISNINANELDPITIAASATYGIPFIIPYSLTNQGAGVHIFNADAPIQFQIIKAWSISTSADGGTWKLYNGASDITNAVTVATSADDFDEPTDYTVAQATIAANGTLDIVPDGGGALDAQIYIMCIRTNP